MASTLSVCKMYDLYRLSCFEDNTSPVSISIYRRIFNTRFNLGFGSPRSDTYSVCDAGVNEEHVDRANKAFEAHKVDKQAANDRTDIIFCTFDLQQTMPLPKLSVIIGINHTSFYGPKMVIEVLRKFAALS